MDLNQLITSFADSVSNFSTFSLEDIAESAFDAFIDDADGLFDAIIDFGRIFNTASSIDEYLAAYSVFVKWLLKSRAVSTIRKYAGFLKMFGIDTLIDDMERYDTMTSEEKLYLLKSQIENVTTLLRFVNPDSVKYKAFEKLSKSLPSTSDPDFHVKIVDILLAAVNEIKKSGGIPVDEISKHKIIFIETCKIFKHITKIDENLCSYILTGETNPTVEKLFQWTKTVASLYDDDPEAPEIIKIIVKFSEYIDKEIPDEVLHELGMRLIKYYNSGEQNSINVLGVEGWVASINNIYPESHQDFGKFKDKFKSACKLVMTSGSTLDAALTDTFASTHRSNLKVENLTLETTPTGNDSYVFTVKYTADWETGMDVYKTLADSIAKAT